MTPPENRERAMMSASVKPIDRPADRTTDLMAAVMSSPRICFHLVPLF